jgi:hypothetical protein
VAIGKELNFVIRARAYHSDHDGIANTLKVKLDFGILQFGEKLEQLSWSVHFYTSAAGKYIGCQSIVEIDCRKQAWLLKNYNPRK